MLRPGVVALFLIFVISISFAYTSFKSNSILEDAYSQVVVVACLSVNNDIVGYGTGWWVNSEHVITAYHVVQACGNITLVRDPWASKAELIAYDQEHDIAVLRAVNPPDWARGLPLSYEARIGDPIYVVGYPIQLFQETEKNLSEMSKIPRVASGTIAWLHPSKPLFQFDIPTDAGNSGGPIVSKESGGVVGIVVYARPGVVSNGFFGLRMDYVAQFLDSQGVSYRVSGGPGLAWAGLGALGILVLVFVLARRK
ncbi:MAG: serine protease [Desulfurococcales archaeon]|nr:serine protease [Desulfurococcales archaeon]